jgi:hypothetical protein
VEDAEARVAELEKVLGWYANSNRYRLGSWVPDNPDIEPGTVMEDNGKRAREALQPPQPVGPARGEPCEALTDTHAEVVVEGAGWPKPLQESVENLMLQRERIDRRCERLERRVNSLASRLVGLEQALAQDMTLGMSLGAVGE